VEDVLFFHSIGGASTQFVWTNVWAESSMCEMMFVLSRKQDWITCCSHLLPTLHRFISEWHQILTTTRLVWLDARCSQ